MKRRSGWGGRRGRGLVRPGSCVGLAMLVLAGCGSGPKPGSEAGVAVEAARAGVESIPAGPAVTVSVDPRVELLAVLFRLGGRDEYHMTRVDAWARAVDAHFGAYADHPAVVMSVRLAGPYGVGFFVPMNLAVHLTPPPGLGLRPGALETPSIHRTWTTYPDTTRHYVDLVGRFARDADLAGFLARNAVWVDTAEARLRRLVAGTVDRSWFPAFWGTGADAAFHLVPGLLNGRASYGVEFAGGDRRELYAIVGVTETDAAGLPTFGAGFTATVVHELNHPYADPLIGENLAVLGPPADSLYARHAEVLRRQAIGSGESLLHESLVRAAVARYRLAMEGPGALEAEVAEQVEFGFEWLPGLVDLLGEYEADRDRYPTMAEFMPRVVAFFREAVAGSR